MDVRVYVNAPTGQIDPLKSSTPLVSAPLASSDLGQRL
jgi:hypothetical protein